MKQKHHKTIKEAFKYRNGLICYAHTILKNWGASEDVVQEAFITALEKAADFKGGSVFLWVKKITYYKCMEHIRSGNRLEVSYDPEIMELLETYINEDFSSKQESKGHALKQCLSNLKPDLRTLLYQYYWKGESCEAQSKLFNKSANALRLILSRTRISLRKCIDKGLKG